MSKGKVFCFHSSSDLYGASRIFLNTVKILKGNDFTPVVFLSEAGQLAEDLRSHQIEVRILRLGILRRKYFNLAGLFNRAYFIVRAIWIICRSAKRDKPVWIYNNTSSSLAPAFASALLRTKLVWHIHEIVDSPRVFARFLAFCLNRFGAVNIVVSSATHDHWLKINHKLKDKLRLIHNGLDIKNFDIHKGFTRKAFLEKAGVKVNGSTIVIGMIGRVHYWKGQTYFVDIAGHIAKAFPDAYFIMAGDAYPGYEYLYREIDERIASLKLENKVVNLGYLKDPLPLFHSLDVLVLPSVLPDPLPTVVLEAMASSLPVVATAHGGALDMVVDQKTGILVPWDDSKKAAEMITPLLKEQGLRDDFGRRGRERINTQFSMQAYSRAILSVAAEVSSR